MSVVTQTKTESGRSSLSRTRVGRSQYLPICVVVVVVVVTRLIVLYLPSLPRRSSLLFIASSNGDAIRYNWKGAKNHGMVLMQQSSGLSEPKRLLRRQAVSSRLEHDSQAAGCQGWSRPAPTCPLHGLLLLQWREDGTAADGVAGERGGHDATVAVYVEHFHYNTVDQKHPRLPCAEKESLSDRKLRTGIWMGLIKHTVKTLHCLSCMKSNIPCPCFVNLGSLARVCMLLFPVFFIKTLA